jgi:hypothetical protein
MRSIGKTLQRVNDYRVPTGTFRPNREQVFAHSGISVPGMLIPEFVRYIAWYSRSKVQILGVPSYVHQNYGEGNAEEGRRHSPKQTLSPPNGKV